MDLAEVVLVLMKGKCSANLRGVAFTELQLEFLTVSFVPWQH